MKSRVLTITAVGLAAIILAACETTPVTPTRPAPPPPPPPPPTPAEEFAWSRAAGTNTLNVEIAYRPGANQLWSCAGSTEALMPETSYSRARIETLYGSADRAIRATSEVRTRSAANRGADYGEYVKTSVCDGRDSFAFPYLPDGAYFIIAQVHETRPGGAPEMVIMQRVQLSGGRPLRVVLPEAGRAPAPPAAAAAAPTAPRRRPQ